jgi:hypothetical protein
MTPTKQREGNSTQQPRHTATSVATVIRHNLEPDTAEQVLAALKQLDGHAITARLLDKLPGGRVEWRLHRVLGEIEIRNRAYLREKREGVRLTLARNNEETVSADFVERQNPSYFKELRERNALRSQALADPALLERVAVLFNEIEEINEKKALAHKRFAVFVTPGEPLSPDRIHFERAIGLREDDQ